MSQIQSPSPGCLSSPPAQLHYRPYEPVHPAVSPSNLWQHRVWQHYHCGALVGGFLGSSPLQKDGWELSCPQLCKPIPAEFSHCNATLDLFSFTQPPVPREPN